VLRDGSERPADLFDERGQFVDSSGKRWIGRKEIDSASEALFAPFSKKNARHRLEDTINGPSETVVASLLWEFATAPAPGERVCRMARMTVVLAAGLKTGLSSSHS
jgi:hypothetical protein